jgi:hypothetical protein
MNTESTTPTNVYSYLFSNTSTVHGIDMANSGLVIGAYIQDIDSNNNREVIVSNYNSSRKVYQISKYVKYDLKNGNLLITNKDDNGIIVYKRNINNQITISSSDDPRERTEGDDYGYETVGDMKINVIEDDSGDNSVLFFRNSFNSVVAVIGKNYDGSITIKNVKRFDPNGVVTGESTSSSTSSSTSTSSSASSSASTSSSTDASGNNLNLDNYILKTQVVPPVCPACPACPSVKVDGKSICGNCGGAGGSGTLTKSGKSTVTSDTASKNPEEERNLVNTIGGAASNTVGAVGDVASSGVNVVGDVASSGVNVVGDVASSTVGAVGDFASSTVGAVGDVASSLIDAGGNVINTASNQQNSVRTTNAVSQNSSGSSGNMGTYSQLDPYSYYGQIPNRPSNNFLPRTADFSTFGR